MNEKTLKQQETARFNSLLIVATPAKRRELLAAKVRELSATGMKPVTIAKKLYMSLEDVWKALK